MSDRDVLDPILVAATTDLFASLGVAVRSSVGDATPAIDRVAVVGFAGDGIRGVLGVGMPHELLVRIAAPVPSTVEGPNDDWLAELTNQLMGRIKNRLLRHGAAVAIALPMVLRGVHIQLVPTTAEVWSYPFEAEGDVRARFCVWLDVSLHGDFALADVSDPSVVVPDEGAVIFF